MSDKNKRFAGLAAAVSAGLILWPLAAAAADEDSGDGADAGTGLGGLELENPDIERIGELSSNMLGSFVWLFVSLAIVITLIILLIKWLSNRNRIWGANRSLRSLGGIALGQNSSMQVVEIAGRIYIVGVGENITLLDKLDDPQQVADIIVALERQSGENWSPANLAGLLKKRRSDEREPYGTNEGRERKTDAESFQQLLLDKLNKQPGRKEQLEAMLQDHKINERLMDNEK